jgi:uncharacterized membrane protein YidH (DUF202 family)
LELTTNNESIGKCLALERTFDGAYLRTALNALGSGVVVLRLFSREFFGMGLVFVAFGLSMLVVNLIRQRKFLNQHRNVWMPFRTNGRYVMVTCILALAAYIAMLVLIIRV